MTAWDLVWGLKAFNTEEGLQKMFSLGEISIDDVIIKASILPISDGIRSVKVGKHRKYTVTILNGQIEKVV